MCIIIKKEKGNKKMSKPLNYETVMQIRISNELKQKAIYKAKDKKLSDYIRGLIEKDCEK